MPGVRAVPRRPRPRGLRGAERRAAPLGVGGATLMPSAFALLRTLCHDERRRGSAIGVWTGPMASGVAPGPVLGGILLEHFRRGSVLLANIPAMVLLPALARAPTAGAGADLLRAAREAFTRRDAGRRGRRGRRHDALRRTRAGPTTGCHPSSTE